MTESSEEPDAADRRSEPAATDAADETHAGSAGDADAQASAEDTDDVKSENSASAPDPDADDDSEDLDALRAEVEESYDFDDFGPADMAEMSFEEWEAAFDPGTWIVGEELLDRVEQELNARVAIREVFAVVERVTDGADRVIAYSDEGYAVIYADGSVEGEGTVLRDVKPTVALCSMESHDLIDVPEDGELPEPREVVQGSGEFGNLMLQIVAGAQVSVGIGLLVAWLALPSLSTVAAPIAAIGFLLIGVFLFLVVANARLSDRFRAEEFRNRLRALDDAGDEWRDVLPAEVTGAADARAGGEGELDGPEDGHRVAGDRDDTRREEATDPGDGPTGDSGA